MNSFVGFMSALLWLAPLIAVIIFVSVLVIARAMQDHLRGDRDGGRPGVVALDEDTALWLADKLRESDIFEGLTDDELSLVVAAGRLRAVAAGQRLARAGQSSGQVFTVLAGQLRLLTRDQGQDFSVRLAHENETVPLASLLDPPVLVTTIEAAVDSQVFEIPSAHLVQLCDSNPVMGLQIYRAVTKSFERRYRATLHNLVTSLNVALQTAQVGTDVHVEA